MEPLNRIGTLIGGRYRVRSLLGAGGMGVVFLAEHEALQRPFAVKVLNRDLADDPRLAQRFQREARAASKIQHPNIVFISDFGTTEDGSLFLVMEYSPGGNLREELVKRARLETPRALRILIQVTDALECAHRAGVVHRDLKPENLLLTEHRGKKDFVKVLDFGVAKLVATGAEAGPALTARGELYGTPAYMSPEQIQGHPVALATDIYALGVVAYELVTGHTPFTGALVELMIAHTRERPIPPSARCPEARSSPALDAIIGKCLAKKADERYASAAELTAALQRLHRVVSGQSTGRSSRDYDEMSTAFRLHTGLRGTRAAEETKTRGDTGLPELVEESPPPPEAEFDRLVRELAEGLRDYGYGSADLTLAFSRLIQAEERVIAEETEVALADALVEEIDLGIDERQSRLRYAMIQLNQERSRLVDPGTLGTAKTMMAGHAQPIPGGASRRPDLDAQVAELEQRMADLERERQTRVAAIEPRLANHRIELRSWAEDVRAHEGVLRNLVKQARRTVDVPELLRIYEQMDDLARRMRTID